MSGLGETARQAARRYGETPAYVTANGEVLTYADLDALSDEVGSWLLARDIREGDVVALMLPSSPAYAVAYVAAAKVGAITAGVNDKLSPA